MFDPSQSKSLLLTASLFDRAILHLRQRRRVSRSYPNLDQFYDKVWREAAAAHGAEITSLGPGVFEIHRGAFRTRVVGNVSDLDGLTTHVVVRSKAVVRNALERMGVPMPRAAAFSIANPTPAFAFLDRTRGPCVVKPLEGTGGGLGVTTEIRTHWQLARAARATSRFGAECFIEEQVRGDNYRLLFLDGVLIDAVLRRPPTVRGDGVSRITELIDRENDCRLAGGTTRAHCLLTLDLDVRRTLASQALSLSSVPEMGRSVIVKTAINENAAPENVVATRLAPETIDAAARVARVFGVRLAGVDLILTDPARPLLRGGGVVLEVNSPPGYFWHHERHDPGIPLATLVLGRLLEDHDARCVEPEGDAKKRTSARLSAVRDLEPQSAF